MLWTISIFAASEAISTGNDSMKKIGDGNVVDKTGIVSKVNTKTS